MANHSPAPWSVDDDVRILSEGGVIAITRCHEMDEENCTGCANARLMIAAPALLAACEAMLAYIESPTVDAAALPFSQIRAAVAKAKGEAK